MNDIMLIVLGASGDLARRKLIPALYHLMVQKKVQKIGIVGAALDDTTVDAIFEGARPFVKHIDEDAWQNLRACMIYERMDVGKESDFTRLEKRVSAFEKERGLSGNRLIYVAMAAEFFCSITTLAASSGLAKRKGESELPWNRLVYEKPFGHDLQSALEINACIKKSFEESQIYRIDHFLTKELVSNIALIRFANCVFEPLWNNKYIDQVHIIVSEDLSIERRGAYYDKYGALADVMQNHMLELLALIAMEAPEKLTGNYVRNRRAEVLKKVQVVDGFLGQYNGYLKENNVAPQSKTETFGMVQLRVANERWAGVPFYLKTGKCLDKKETIIHIKFKPVDCLLTHNCPVPSNWLTIQVFPEETFSLSLNVKKPGYKDEVVPVPMEFCHSCLFGAMTPQAYEVVLEEVMRGEQSISVRFDEIEYAWQVIDKIRAMKLTVHSYDVGSPGPIDAIDAFEKKHDMEWKS